MSLWSKLRPGKKLMKGLSGLQGEEAAPSHSLQPATFTNKLAFYCSEERRNSRDELLVWALKKWHPIAFDKKCASENINLVRLHLLLLRMNWVVLKHRLAHQISTPSSWFAGGWPSLGPGAVAGSVHTGRSQECSACRCPCSLCAARRCKPIKVTHELKYLHHFYKLASWDKKIIQNSTPVAEKNDSTCKYLCCSGLTCTCHNRSCSHRRGWSRRCSAWCPPRSCHLLTCWGLCPWKLRPALQKQKAPPLLVVSTWRVEGRLAA